ncbi:NAD-dependent epimerase/dehydratase family protein [Flagellimonas olearia]|uniref:NAD-dependent epimerase/dehydratase family protein n=1 Tax=Flagellimonas olearia TaxID=552546 RepID=A0A6I1E0U2_9FLAO|nr:NAD-dependent epimerase/dehydratase family protein [Allomuricauda olearia]KAB7530202.1 NAD-dependent epimerase/dehydratase family protein [Allomuricauda olearia]
MKTQEKILITGSGGQLGTALAKALANRYGTDHVMATDLHPKTVDNLDIGFLDTTDTNSVDTIIEKHEISQIYHLAAILSANGEANPAKTWEINTKSWLNVLEASKKHEVTKVFFPSSIAVFGPSANKLSASQTDFLDPLTVYGISKAVGEQWGHYFFSKYGLDVRSLRYPGVIGHGALPGGGTTDYAVDIYHQAVQNKPYTCYLTKDTILPMIFMDDAVRATIELMETPKENICTRTSYNLNGLTFAPWEIVESIQKWFPGFEVIYSPDFRQSIANAWPSFIDGSPAKKDWGWSPHYTLDEISGKMIAELSKIYKMEKLK